MRLSAMLICALAASPFCFAGFFSRSGKPGNSNTRITLRKRLHINTLIAQPGTAEIDWSNLYSLTSTNFAMPSGLRYTPSGSHILWGRTEYSAAFDTIASVNVGGSRLTQFSQALTLTGQRYCTTATGSISPSRRRPRCFCGMSPARVWEP